MGLSEKVPSKQQYGKDVREPSPNNRATCKICRKRIRRGELRVGKWTTNPGFYSSGIPYPPCFVYYHDRCVPDSFRQTLKLPDPGIKEKRHVLLQERRRLREQLRQMRLEFARHLDMPPYCIFENATLDSITVRLPRTKSELLLCYGIKEKRYRNFGEAILAITRSYNTTQTMGHSCSNRSNTGDDDDTIQVTETLSIEDIVSKRFRDAEENGYLIEL